MDAGDGAESIQLGPSPLQEEIAPCESLGLQVSSSRAVNQPSRSITVAGTFKDLFELAVGYDLCRMQTL